MKILQKLAKKRPLTWLEKIGLAWLQDQIDLFKLRQHRRAIKVKEWYERINL